MKFIFATLLLLMSTFVDASTFTNSFQPGHSGFWHNPNVDGTGLNVTVNKNQIGVAIYTHAPEEAGAFENEGRFLPWQTGAWFIGSATVLPGQYSVDIDLYSSNCYFGNRVWDDLGSNNYGCETRNAGTLTLEVYSCSVLKANIEIGGSDGSTTVSADDTFGLVPVMTALALCENECNVVDVSPPNPACSTARLKGWPRDLTVY